MSLGRGISILAVGLAREGENNAWNYLNHLFNLGALRSLATMVAQQGLGLSADRRPGAHSRHSRNSRAPRPHLVFAALARREVIDG